MDRPLFNPQIWLEWIDLNGERICRRKQGEMPNTPTFERAKLEIVPLEVGELCKPRYEVTLHIHGFRNYRMGQHTEFKPIEFYGKKIGTEQYYDDNRLYLTETIYRNSGDYARFIAGTDIKETIEMCELPKTMEVGKTYKTDKCPEDRDFDLRILAVIKSWTNDNPEIIHAQTVDTNRHRKMTPNLRTVIVYEEWDKQPGFSEHKWQIVQQELPHFINRMEALKVQAWEPPNVERMLERLYFDCSNVGNDGAFFVSEKAMRQIEQSVKHSTTQNYKTIQTYNGIHIYEVPGIEGFRVWLGKE